MDYEVHFPLPWPSIVGPLSAADDALSRLDERLRASPIRQGWIARTHIIDACASAWIDGELVHIEDLVLHDARMDIRSPTRELTRAHEVLRARRRIFHEAPHWALSPSGLNALIGRAALSEPKRQGARRSAKKKWMGSMRSASVLRKRGRWSARRTPFRNRGDQPTHQPPFVRYGRAFARRSRSNGLRSRLGRKRADGVVARSRREHGALPRLLAAAIALLAWEEIDPLQHRAWLGRLLIGAILRGRSRTLSHLLCVSAGLRRSRAIDGVRKIDHEARGPSRRFRDGGESGMKEHDRWLLGRRQLDRRLVGRRSNSSLPALADLVIARPILSAGLIAKELKVTPRAAQDLVTELNLREMTGRGRYRAWGIL